MNEMYCLYALFLMLVYIKQLTHKHRFHKLLKVPKTTANNFQRQKHFTLHAMLNEIKLAVKQKLTYTLVSVFSLGHSSALYV